MSLRIDRLRRITTDGEVETTDFSENTTLLIGRRNTSKTTSLKMIDFCLGEADSASRSLGGDVAEAYLGIELDLSVGGDRHVVSRAVQTEFGRLTQIRVDDESLTPREFQSWIMNQLGWPEIMIPKGRDPRSATEVVPLTFRSLLRHLYRREGSWLEFATHEEEFLRRAVTAFFLGLAETRYSLAEYDAGRLERAVADFEAQLRSLDETSFEIVSRVGDRIGLQDARPESLDEIEGELAERLHELERRRRDIQSTLESDPAFQLEQGERYKALDESVERTLVRENELERLLDAHRTSKQEIDAELERLARADASIAEIAELPVNLCPACGQGISAAPVEGDEHCYLCGQEVQPDARHRRIDLEKSALGRERAEVEGQIAATTDELSSLKESRQRLEADREALRMELDRQRAELISPYMSELEGISREAGAVSQQMATVDGLRVLRERRDKLVAELAATRSRLQLANSAAGEVRQHQGLSAERCELLADRMNDFLFRLREEPWQFPPTALTAEDFTFYVGTRLWETALGAEAKVLFFVAYHAAMLRLGVDSGESVPAPGLAILDNPLQHGIGEGAITEALDQLAGLAIHPDVQVIVTLPQALDLSAAHERIVLERQYGTQTGG